LLLLDRLRFRRFFLDRELLRRFRRLRRRFELLRLLPLWSQSVLLDLDTVESDESLPDIVSFFKN